MVRLAGAFSRLSSKRILLAGDLLLDTYTFGKAKRISPEAPVAIVNTYREEHRPGGAGNVILNILSMGCSVTSLGRVGDDSAAKILLESLQSEGVDTSAIFVQHGYCTPVKNRIIAENQQIVRVDRETFVSLNEQLEQQIIDMLPSLLASVDLIALSDYGKGFLSVDLIRALIDEGNRRGIPIVTDPKGIDFSKYAYSTLIKPNLGELYAAASLPPDAPLAKAAACVLERSKCQSIMVTRAEEGISLFHQNGERQDFPVRMREVKDVTGAGDTVLAMIACAMANQLEMGEAAQLANVAAGLAIEHIGCARISLSELARRLLEIDLTNKVFDEEHLFALKKSLEGRQFALLSIDSSNGIHSKLFHAIRKISSTHTGRDLIVYIKDNPEDPEFIDLLASLHEVDFVILKSENLRSLCAFLTPAEIYDFDGLNIKNCLAIS